VNQSIGKGIKTGLLLIAISILGTGCAQKVRIKALQPAEVGAMAAKKKVAISEFKNDKVGLSGKIESQIARHKLDKKRYFTVLSRKDMAKIIAEQKLQSSDLMDEKTSVKIGKLIGAQAIINGEITSATAESGQYQENREKCIAYYKDSGQCARYRYYTVTCRTTQASVSASLNIVDMESGSIIYGDTLSKDYNGDSCKDGRKNLGLLVLDTGSKKILSKGQALNKLADAIASEFVYKLTPNYVYFSVALLDEIELENVTDNQKLKFKNALEYIKAARYDRAKEILSELMKDFDGKSYVVAYVLGVVYEATGDFDTAKEFYTMADKNTVAPVDEINMAINRIDALIEKREEARKQMNTK
jgi:curli biogenesis system outer membrane secretion channel CsgG